MAPPPLDDPDEVTHAGSDAAPAAASVEAMNVRRFIMTKSPGFNPA
jgi:hypothetical protein